MAPNDILPDDPNDRDPETAPNAPDLDDDLDLGDLDDLDDGAPGADSDLDEDNDLPEPAGPDDAHEDDGALDGLDLGGDEPEPPAGRRVSERTERNRRERALLSDFMRLPFETLESHARVLSDEAERVRDLARQREREERRQARADQATIVAPPAHYKAPNANPADEATRLVLDQALSGISDRPPVHHPLLDESGNLRVGFGSESQSRRAVLGLMGLLPEWKAIEKSDLLEGRRVFNRIAMLPQSATETLSGDVPGFERRALTAVRYEIGWRCDLSIRSVDIHIGDLASIVVARGLSSDSILRDRDRNLCLVIQGGKAELRKQIAHDHPLLPPRDLDAAVRAALDGINDTNKAALIEKAVGVRAWSEGENENEDGAEIGVDQFVGARNAVATREWRNALLRHPEGHVLPRGSRNSVHLDATALAALYGPASLSSTLSGTGEMTLTCRTPEFTLTYLYAEADGPDALFHEPRVTLTTDFMDPVTVTFHGDERLAGGRLIHSALSNIAGNARILHAYLSEGAGKLPAVIAAATELLEDERNLLAPAMPGAESVTIDGLPHGIEPLTEMIAAWRDELAEQSARRNAEHAEARLAAPDAAGIDPAPDDQERHQVARIAGPQA